MKSILTVIISYAVVFAPGCRQTTSHLQNSKKQPSIIDQMRAQAYKSSNQTGEGFDAILNNRENALKDYNVYAAFGTKTIRTVDASILKDLDIKKPIVDKQGNKVTHLFIQSKSGNQSVILGVSYIDHIKTQQRMAVLVEDLKLKTKSTFENPYDLTQYNTDDLKRIKAIPLKMNLKERDSELVRKDATTSAQGVKVLLDRVSAKMNASSTSFGLTRFTGAHVGIVFSTVIMVLLAAAIVSVLWDLRHGISTFFAEADELQVFVVGVVIVAAIMAGSIGVAIFKNSVKELKRQHAR